MVSFPEFLNDSSIHDGPGAKVTLPWAGFITLSLLMAVFSITAVVLNATVIVVTLRHKQLWQPLNFALVNLAVADLGITLTGSVPSVVTNALGYYIMGWVGCVLEGFCIALFGKSVPTQNNDFRLYNLEMYSRRKAFVQKHGNIIIAYFLYSYCCTTNLLVYKLFLQAILNFFVSARR